MAAKAPIPVITSGKTEKVGKIVMDHLAPEVEVVHFVLADASKTEIPTLLSDRMPDPQSSKLGAGTTTTTAPKALILGGAYDDAAIAELQGLVQAAGGRRVPWLRVDSTTFGETPGSPEYAAAVGRRCRDKVLRLEEEGKLDAVEGDAVYYV